MRNHDSYHVYFSPNPREKSRNSHLHYASKLYFGRISHISRNAFTSVSLPSSPRVAVSRRSEEKERGRAESVIKSPWRAWSSIPLVSTRACVTTHALSHSWRLYVAQGCSSSGSLLYHASSTVYSFSPFFSLSLFHANRSLFGPAVRCIIIATTGEERGEERRRGWWWRACVYGAIFARNLEPFQASVRDLYVKHACARIEFNIPWI